MKSFAARMKQTPLYKWVHSHKKILGACIIAITFILLFWYVYTHPEIVASISRISPLTIMYLSLLYSILVAVNIAIVYVTVRLCSKELSLKNSAFLSIYSSLINFFGPLQSGPGARAVYLKAKLGLRIRDYTFAMLFYYFAYAAISTSLVFVTTLPLLTLTGIIIGILLIMYGTRRFNFSDKLHYIIAIYIVTIIQIIVTALVYYTELHTVGSGATIVQALSYTGSANLALFVSLTPGAIGIREAFLLFTQSLHGISTNYIVAAGIIDRAFYTLFLIVLLVFSALFHMKETVTLGREK